MSDTADFFRSRLDRMIDLRHPLAVLASRMPWQEIEASVAHLFALDIAGSLAAEPDLARLLDRVVNETFRTMGAAGGIAFLPDDKGALLPAHAGQLGAAAHASVLPVPEVEAGSPIARAFASGSTVVATIAPGSGGALAFLSPRSPSC